jgi:hypothetical protein
MTSRDPCIFDREIIIMYYRVIYFFQFIEYQMIKFVLKF